jgi:hypothetical protein
MSSLALGARLRLGALRALPRLSPAAAAAAASTMLACPLRAASGVAQPPGGKRLAASLPWDDSWSLLARAIMADPEPTPQSTHIILCGGAQWPAIHWSSPVLFLRPFYAAFYDGVLGCARTGFTCGGVQYRSVCVSGNPGIGKSAFGFYALFRALRAGRTVVFHYDSGTLSSLGGPYVFRGDRVSRDWSAVDDALNDPDTLFISDCVVPPVVPAFTLFITAPRQERTWGFRKTDSATVLYFPVMSWQEVASMRAACFPHLDEAGVWQRFTRWGGIPRYALHHRSGHGRLLRSTAASTTERYLRTSLLFEPAESGVDSEVALCAFHVKVRGEVDATLRPDDADYYRYHSRELASKYVAHAMLQHDAWRPGQPLRGAMLELLAQTAGQPQLASARGRMFEELALRRLATGGVFGARWLGGSTSTDRDKAHKYCVEVTPARRRVFCDFGNLDRHLPAEGEQLERDSHTPAVSAIDAVLVGSPVRKLVVVAVDAPTGAGVVLRDDGRPKFGLAAAVAALGLLRDGEAVALYWVVPPQAFDAWTQPQPLMVSVAGEPLRAMTPAEVASDAVACRVVQYAVRVDLIADEPDVADELVSR